MFFSGAVSENGSDEDGPGADGDDALLPFGLVANPIASATEMAGAYALFPTGFNAASASPEVSCKLSVLQELLSRTKAAGSDRFVVVSNFTIQLDYIARMCESRGWGCERLDGSVEVNKRQALVDRFNSPHWCVESTASHHGLPCSVTVGSW